MKCECESPSIKLVAILGHISIQLCEGGMLTETSVQTLQSYKYGAKPGSERAHRILISPRQTTAVLRTAAQGTTGATELTVC